MLCNRKTHALHSKVIISSPDTWSTSYKQVSTVLTMILRYNECMCRLKVLDPTKNKLRLRSLQPNLPYSLSSHSRVDMALQSGPTIHFCFPYISKSNGWQV